MAASSREGWDSFINRMCRLEAENAVLKTKVQLLSERASKAESKLSEQGSLAVQSRGLVEENKALKQAGTRLSHRIKDVLDNIIDESALIEALEQWDIAKEE